MPSFGEGIEAACQRNRWCLEVDGTSPRLAVGSEWNECHEASYLLSHHHLNRPSDKMDSSFLCLPISRRRSRSKARSEIGSEGLSEAGRQAVPHPAASTPDLRIGTSTSPPSRPLAPRNQELNGMGTVFFRTIYLTTLFQIVQNRSFYPFRSDPICFWKRTNSKRPFEIFRSHC